MPKFRLDSERLSIIALGVAGGLMVSGMGGAALGQFALAGIDPRLADAYRQPQAEQIAVEDHDLTGRATPVGADDADMIGAVARPRPIAFQQDDPFIP